MVWKFLCYKIVGKAVTILFCTLRPLLVLHLIELARSEIRYIKEDEINQEKDISLIYQYRWKLKKLAHYKWEKKMTQHETKREKSKCIGLFCKI